MNFGALVRPKKIPPEFKQGSDTVGSYASFGI